MSRPVTEQPNQYGSEAYQHPQYQMAQPMQQQPAMAGNVVLMQKPAPIPGVPPGLEYLASIDQLVIKQVIEIFEVLTDIETKNKYRIFNSMKQQVFYAAEESNICMRILCGPGRGFKMHITDNLGQEVITMVRPFMCCAGCCWCAGTDCCAFTIEVQAPPGTPIGYIRQECSAWTGHLTIRDVDMNVMARVRGPCCPCSCPCCGDVEFPVTSPDEKQPYGAIAKQWSGCFQECCTKADTFRVAFPLDMDVRMKATMLGAMFLIEFMFFESKNKKHDD